MTTDQKTAIVKEFGSSEKDVGGSAVQVAILTARVNELTEHLKIHKKDHSSRRGLLAMVNRRRKLLTYIQRLSSEQYLALIRRLNLRR
jgi:small subunit ribosomal protein S15